MAEFRFLEDRAIFDPTNQAFISKYAFNHIRLVSKNWNRLVKSVQSQWDRSYLKANKWFVKEEFTLRGSPFKVSKDVNCLELQLRRPLTITHLVPAFKSVKQISKLSLKNYSCNSFKELSESLGVLPCLTSLQLFPSDIIQDDTLDDKRLTKLVNLSLVGNFKGEHLLKFAELFPNLEYLRLEAGQNLTGLQFSNALQKWPRLRKLDLLGCASITQKELEFVFNEGPALTSIFIGGVSQQSGNGLQFLKKLPLKSLGIAQHLTDEEFIGIAEMETALQDLHLHHLSVSGSALLEFVKRQPNLICLELKNCQEIAYHDFAQIIERCPQLLSIKISDCGPLQGFHSQLLKLRFPHIHFFLG